MSKITLPTIHRNGTSKRMLTVCYDDAGDKLHEFVEAWRGIEFNSRDYYPQGPYAWQKALDEREAMNAKIHEVMDYIFEIRKHLYDV